MKSVGKIGDIALVLMILSTGTVHAEVPAFSGAEGYGTQAKGGRDRQVIHITNLEEKGAGSFRTCAEAEGARTCVFDMGAIMREV